MKEIKVVCGVVRDNEKVLITQRGDKKNRGKWEFPGGKVNEGEEPFVSVKRELREELELDIVPVKERIRYNYKSFLLIFIECICCDPNTINLKEHLGYKWVNVSELVEYDFLEGDRRFIDELTH